jgi:two-component system, OmpR family, response regulator
VGEGVSLFRWVAGRSDLPAQWDLRRAGWRLSDFGADDVAIHLVDMRRRRAATALRQLAGTPAIERCVFIGVESSNQRVRLLEARAADALPSTVGLRELDLRARRIAAAGEQLPRRREFGPLTLDLIHRDARATGGAWLSLHPREFGLLWRLAERPGEPVSRVRLLRDVWRLDFEPGTNSVEVHVSRLRAKLAGAGLAGLVETDPQGGYRLAAPGGPVERADLRLCAQAISC